MNVPSDTPGPPWEGKRWAKRADAAELKMGGSGYIVHTMEKASQWATILTVAFLVLTLVQLGIAFWRAWSPH